jgi:hypothetical protein
VHGGKPIIAHGAKKTAPAETAIGNRPDRGLDAEAAKSQSLTGSSRQENR